MELADFNYEITGGQMAVTKRRLQTMFIVFNETAQRFVVKNDADGRTYAAGFASVDEAVAHCLGEDRRRNAI